MVMAALPIGEYAAVALLIWFGFRSIKAAWDLPSEQPGTSEDSSDSGELAEAQEFLEKSKVFYWIEM
jgi:threonine/homoserine/homoserine lactone efflux protein